MKKIKLLLSGKPRIEYYIDAAERLGAEVVAEYLPAIDTQYDGLILCGGSDVDPKYYNETINGSKDIDKERDENEFALLKAYIDAGKPVFGICRGFQLINIYFGGTLYQDIKEADLHKRINEKDSVHSITADEDSIVGKLYGKSVSINSAHHQALKDLGKGLKATAYWQDKYIEAIEHTEFPIFAVQWHPERTCFSMARNDTCDGSKLFEYFIKLCKEYRNK
jgi:putative glutamine amidotransferase